MVEYYLITVIGIVLAFTFGVIIGYILRKEP